MRAREARKRALVTFFFCLGSVISMRSGTDSMMACAMAEDSTAGRGSQRKPTFFRCMPSSMSLKKISSGTPMSQIT